MKPECKFSTYLAPFRLTTQTAPIVIEPPSMLLYIKKVQPLLHPELSTAKHNTDKFIIQQLTFYERSFDNPVSITRTMKSVLLRISRGYTSERANDFPAAYRAVPTTSIFIPPSINVNLFSTEKKNVPRRPIIAKYTRMPLFSQHKYTNPAHTHTDSRTKSNLKVTA